MSERILTNAADKVAKKAKLPTIFWVILLLCIATGSYIFTTKWYIAVPGNSLQFELPSFKTCEITFRRPVIITSYTLKPGENLSGGDNPLVDKPSTVHALGERASIIITNQPNAGKSTIVEMTLGPSLNVEISKVSVDGRTLGVGDFVDNNLKSKGEVIRTRYIRHSLADFILTWNEVFANFILTFMFFGLTLQFIVLGVMEYRAHCPEKHFEKFLIRSLKIEDISVKKERGKALDTFRSKWWESANKFRFYQALGPALGFIMTVASLVQALHPTNLTSHNLDGFLNGIHVAMIATFLGLLLRLVALEAGRVNDALLKRAEIRLDLNLESKKP